MEHRLRVFITVDCLSAYGGEFEIAESLEPADDLYRAALVISQARLFCLLKEPEPAGVAPHHPRYNGIEGHGVVGRQDQAYVPEIGTCRSVPLHPDYCINDEEVRYPEAEYVNYYFVEAFRAACYPVEPCLLGPGQETIAVLDRPGHNGKAVGLEFRQADDNVCVKHYPGEAHERHEVRIKGDLLRIVPDVLIVALRCLHKACPFEGLLVRAVAEKARIVPHNNGRRPHRFHLVHNGTKDRRVGDDAFLRL
ncbi:MAG: hypothetical protein A4E64_01267 [Syntrophorhabdus sp. PtaU1.Bin058]|nr:MAG: hypothetical protein A4E64_01267 [Syntrophorhabdus sp. PtaU1.Bin058]